MSVPQPSIPRRSASPGSRTARSGVRRQPQRTCVSCRNAGDKRTLTRLVRGTDGYVSLDVAGRAPGRGAYLCTQRECWERALGRADILGRALKVTVTADNRAALLAAAPAAAHEADEDSNPPAGDAPDGDKGERL